jgi:hypothetical protein
LNYTAFEDTGMLERLGLTDTEAQIMSYIFSETPQSLDPTVLKDLDLAKSLNLDANQTDLLNIFVENYGQSLNYDILIDNELL